MPGLEISVIICTKNRFNDFQDTIASLTRQRRLPDELIVVDASDQTGIDDYLSRADLPFKFQYFHTQPGLTYQRNYGIQRSTGSLLFFFDDDVILGTDYIEHIQNVFDSDLGHKIGAVGGRIKEKEFLERVPFRSRLLHWRYETYRLIFLESRMGNGKFRYSGMPTHPHHLDTSRYIECLSGCCMAFRKEVFVKAGFDEVLKGYALMEDADISKQVLNAGYLIYYEASAILEHKTSPHGRINEKELAETRVVNYVYLFRKNWPQTWPRIICFYWILLGMLLINLRQPTARQGIILGIHQSVCKENSMNHEPSISKNKQD
jgi:GT2 family glycosyltransferase